MEFYHGLGIGEWDNIASEELANLQAREDVHSDRRY